MLNVNVAAHQLSDQGFVARVAATLAETGVSPARLTLEITESTAVELGDSVTNLEVLRRMGIRISLDDFGTGRSTLTMLHELPVDQLAEQAQRLSALGYRYAQGFHFARPLPADEVSRLIGRTAPV